MPSDWVEIEKISAGVVVLHDETRIRKTEDKTRYHGFILLIINVAESAIIKWNSLSSRNVEYKGDKVPII